MTPPSTPTETVRTPLSRTRVLEGAVALADHTGIDSVTIRRLADELDVKPMTIYHHLANKEAIVDGMVDLVFAEITQPASDTDWRSGMRARALSARAVLGRHPWATPLMESRAAPGPATLHHHDAVLGCLRRAGFTMAMTAHAYALVDSYIYGFALQEANLPASSGDEIAELAEDIIETLPADEYPHLTEFTACHVLEPGYDFGDEFEFGLDLILDGLEAAAGQDSGNA